MKKRLKKVGPIFLLVVGIVLLWFSTTPTQVVSQLYFSVYRREFEVCANYLNSHPEVVSIYKTSVLDGKQESSFVLVTKNESQWKECSSTNDDSIDAAIKKVQSIYLFSTIEQQDECVFFSLNKFSSHFSKTLCGIQYAPTKQEFLFDGEGTTKKYKFDDGWFYTVRQDT